MPSTTVYLCMVETGVKRDLKNEGYKWSRNLYKKKTFFKQIK